MSAALPAAHAARMRGERGCLRILNRGKPYLSSKMCSNMLRYKYDGACIHRGCAQCACGTVQRRLA